MMIFKPLSYNLTITSAKTPGEICAVSTLETIYDKHGFHVLDRVLRLIIGTWEGEPNSLSANMLNGVARFVAAYGDQIKDTVFKERLSRISIKTLRQTARDRHVGSLGFAEDILIYYNKSSKVHLTCDKIYAKKAPRKNKAEDLMDYIPPDDDSNYENLNESSLDYE